MKKLCMFVAAMLVMSMLASSAFACTALYVGANLTATGNTYFGRSEDISNSYNKVMSVFPAGYYKAGEVYQGCYGFNYCFTKDSYSFNAMSDDNLGGVCPDCGGEHAHNPYGAAGTNEMGVTITATESLGGSKEAKAADPMNRTYGIEEAEIVTVILAEAATAKEGVELLCKIYDIAGAHGGSGIFIADNTETWYIENVTGYQYIAVKLSADMAFCVPNQSVIGKIDLDDTENVIASPALIAVVKNAGLLVGDADENVIDYAASYNAAQVANTRMINGLNYLCADAGYTADALPTMADYTISNVDAAGNIVPMYTNVKVDRAMTVADVIDYWKVAAIGLTGNLNCHVFEINAQDSLTDTVEWIGMDHGAYTLFVPYYPMLTTDVAPCYKVGGENAQFVQEEPTAGIYYATSANIKNEAGERVKVEGFKTYPSNWADSMYWSFDALSNLCELGNYTDKADEVKAAMAVEQAALYAGFAEMAQQVAAAATTEEAAQIATQASMDMACQAHEAAVKMINELIGQ